MTSSDSETGQKATATLSGQQAPLQPTTAIPDVDPDDPPEEFSDALEAEDFIVYGKASIEKFDTGGENSDVPEILDMDAMQDALGRFFQSEKAPGIISIGHDDIPVGRPLPEYELEEDAAIEVDGDTYEFGAGDTLTTHIEDGDGDGRPELWMLGDLAKDTDISRKVRLGILLDELDGFSVTFGRHQGGTQPEGEGRRVTSFDLFSVTVAPAEFIANKGSEFDLAAFKAQMNRLSPTATADDATPTRLAEDLARDFRSIMTNDNNEDSQEPDADTILQRMGQKLMGDNDNSEESTTDEGQKSTEGGDEGQKEDGDSTVEDLVRALAEELDEDPDKLMEALGQAANDDEDGGEDEEEDEDEEEEDGMKSESEDDGSVDFGAKLEEHGVITETDLGEKLDSLREEVVEDVGSKLADAQSEAIEEVAQKMESAGTPTPAGGSMQDSEDFEAKLKDVTDTEGW